MKHLKQTIITLVLLMHNAINVFPQDLQPRTTKVVSTLSNFVTQDIESDLMVDSIELTEEFLVLSKGDTINPADVVEAYYNNPDYADGGVKQFSQGEYYYLLKEIKDPIEQKKIVLRAWNQISSRPGYYYTKLAAYLANRMAIYAMDDPICDSIIWKPIDRFIDERHHRADLEIQISFNNTNKWVVNRHQLVVNKAALCIKHKEYVRAWNLFSILPTYQRNISDDIKRKNYMLSRINKYVIAVEKGDSLKDYERDLFIYAIKELRTYNERTNAYLAIEFQDMLGLSDDEVAESILELNDQDPDKARYLRLKHINPKAVKKKKKKSARTMKALDSDFNYKLLSKLSENNEDNVFISPLRLQAMLVLLANWTKPSIKKDILATVMGKRAVNIEDANNKCYMAPFVSSYPQVNLSTMIWFNKNVQYNQQALTGVEKHFPIEVKTIDFNSPDAIDTIDITIDRVTHGLIKKLDIQSPVDVLITDILYFKGEWMYEFDIHRTTTKRFYGANKTNDVQMMRDKSDRPYWETPLFQSVELEYISKEKDYAMRVFLPKKGYTCDEVLSSISALKQEASTFKKSEVELSFPRFEAETNTSFKDILQKIGLGNVFESDNIIPGLADKLQLIEIQQQNKIEVNERGTEAASVTEAHLMLGSAPEYTPPIVMNVNRPFVFEIVETRSNTVLFSGIIKNLSK